MMPDSDLVAPHTGGTFAPPEFSGAALFPAENPNPVFRVMPDGQVIYANRASDALMAAWGVAGDGCIPPPWRERIAAALAEGQPRLCDVECDGRTLQLNCVPIVVAGYVNVYASDVTDRIALLAELAEKRRREAELTEELRRERDLQQAVLEHTQFSLVYLDRDFNFVSMNAAYELACQRPRSEMLGRNHFELFPNAENEAIFRRVRDTGEPVMYVAKPFEFADQPWRGVTYWDWTLTPVRAPGGPVEGLVFSLVDVTERVRAANLGAALNDIHAAIASQTDSSAILQTAMERSAAALGCDLAAIGRREDNHLVLSHGVGFAPGELAGLILPDHYEQGLVQLAETRRAWGLLYDENEPSLGQEMMAQYGIRAVLAVPLVVRDEAIGLLNFGFARPRTPFSAAEMDFVSKLATAVSLTLENVRVLELAASQRSAAEARAAELEAILDAISDGVMLYGPDGKVVRQNATAAQILGYRSAESDLALGERIERVAVELVSDPTAGFDKMPIVRSLQGETVHGELLRLRPLGRAESELRYVLTSTAPVRDASGALLGAVASFTDVTELHRMRDELDRLVQERTAELEAIIASMPDAVFVANGTGVLRCNQAALDLVGYKSLDELRVRGPALAEHLQTRYAETGQPIPTEELGLTRALRGEHVVLESATRHPLTNEQHINRVAVRPVELNGEIIAAVALMTDITEQKRLQRELAYQAELLENVYDAIMAYDADMRITAWNRRAEEQYGWSAGEAIGAIASEVVGSQVSPEDRAEVVRIMKQGGRWRGEAKHTRRDGTTLIVEATSMSLCGPDGRLRGFVTVNRDITERKQAEAQNAELLAQLKASREQLQAFSRRLVTMQESERSYVADQLYNQAGQVLAGLQLQLAHLASRGPEGTPGEQLPGMVAILQDAIGQLHALARELRPVGLDRSTLANVLQVYAADFGRANRLAVHFRPGDAETLRVPADVGTALFRCVQEGLNNVARHAHASEVVLSLKVEGGDLVVTLADDGVGFGARVVGADKAGLQPANEAGPTSWLGIASIRERLEMVGGQLTIVTGKSGTTLTMQAPIGGAF